MKKQNSKPSGPASVRTVGEAWAMCPYKTLIGDVGPGNPWDRVTCVAAAIGGEPEPFGPEIMRDIAKALHAGGVVLVMADRPEAREMAKRQVAAILPAAGRA